MFRMYLPSALVATIVWTRNLGNIDKMGLAGLLLCVHFWKRVLEVAFVHRYSGTMPASTGNTIGFYYSLFTLMIASWGVRLADSDKFLNSLGMCIFAVGIAGNAYHHWLLSKLRSIEDPATKKKKYIPPKGGLFHLVAAPHYMFELVGWLGMALVAQQMNAFLTFAGMAAYLSARASMTNERYMEEFSQTEWPRTRRAILPWVF